MLTMTCDDFEQYCQARLDRPGGIDAAVSRRMETHAKECARCRSRADGYAILGRALRSLGPSPAPSAEIAPRVVAAWAAERERPAVLSLGGGAIRWAAAAAVLLVALALRAGWRGDEVKPVSSPPAVVETVPAESRPLSDALADATAATWDLARATSGPAARLGREVLASAEVPEARLDLPIEAPAPSEVLQLVGRSVEAGVRPLSGTARRAFSFLSLPGQRADAAAPPGA